VTSHSRQLRHELRAVVERLVCGKIAVIPRHRHGHPRDDPREVSVSVPADTASSPDVTFYYQTSRAII